jgi:DNA-binding CsgD family transcriptional regulator
MSGTLDLLRIVEAAYDLDSPDEVWLQRIAELVRPHLDDGFGLAAFTFTRVPDQPPLIQTSLHLWMPDPLAEVYPKLFKNMAPELRQRPFELGPCVTGSQMMNMKKQQFSELPQMKAGVQRFGMFDSVWITATDPSGVGCGFHAGRREIAWAKQREIQRWGRIAAHLTSALRIRVRLRAGVTGGEPSAVFDPDGALQDAQGSAREPKAREALRKAVVTMEHARGAERRTNPDGALEQWRALVGGHWSLLDQIEVNGRRYIVARENEPRAGGMQALTERERQIVGYAQLGHHNKLIAYELGIAHSTVRVLLSRAAAKLGARTREELLRTARVASP